MLKIRGACNPELKSNERNRGRECSLTSLTFALPIKFKFKTIINYLFPHVLYLKQRKKFAGGPPVNNFLFARGPPANNLFLKKGLLVPVRA